MYKKSFDIITITAPIDKIYARLGYSRGITRLSQKQKAETDKYIEQALSLIELKGVGAQLTMEKIESAKIFLEQGVSFVSSSLAQFLGGCSDVCLLAATAGSRITQAIEKNSCGSDVTAAVVFDAVASEMTDAGLGWILKNYNSHLCRQNKRITARRFSAGYGDFGLENQKIIYEILDLKRFGITLTGSYMFIPEKTVTAVAGIKPVHSEQ